MKHIYREVWSLKQRGAFVEDVAVPESPKQDAFYRRMGEVQGHHVTENRGLGGSVGLIHRKLCDPDRQFRLCNGVELFLK